MQRASSGRLLLPGTPRACAQRSLAALLVHGCGLAVAALGLMPTENSRAQRRIAAFLCSTLRGTNQDKYDTALQAFSSSLADLGWDFWSLTEEQCDILLAERMIDMFEERVADLKEA